MFYYTSDLHIGCKNSFENRTLEHDQIIINNWNKVIHNDDTVFILGDIGRLGSNKDNAYVASIVSQLKAKKILIVGNHDQQGIKDNRVNQLFTEVTPYKEIIDNFNGRSHNLVLSHYPIYSWNGAYKGWIHLYGHTHNNFDHFMFQEALQKLRDKVHELNIQKEMENSPKFKAEPYAYNVGCMLWDYTPITLKQILERNNINV